jgi:hypothetical protein
LLLRPSEAVSNTTCLYTSCRLVRADRCSSAAIGPILAVAIPADRLTRAADQLAEGRATKALPVCRTAGELCLPGAYPRPCGRSATHLSA